MSYSAIFFLAQYPKEHRGHFNFSTLSGINLQILSPCERYDVHLVIFIQESPTGAAPLAENSQCLAELNILFSQDCLMYSFMIFHGGIILTTLNSPLTSLTR